MAEQTTPIETRDRDGRPQDLYRFDNGYGASALRWTNGVARWDLAVIQWHGNTFSVVLHAPIAEPFLDSLAESEVHKVLAQIKALPIAAVPTEA